MRYLKRKIKLVQDSSKKYDNHLDIKVEEAIQTNSQTSDSSLETDNSESVQEFLLPMRRPRQKPTCPDGNSKNIVKNYGKALCSFASSKVAVPYLANIMERAELKSVKIPIFAQHIKSKKEKLNSIESLRKLLVPEPSDDAETREFKILFKEISIIFLKYFAVNWIFGGRLTHKNAHLKYRFKMLRRIQNPEHFTYLKTSAK